MILNLVMKILKTPILVSIVLFMEIATLVEGTTDGIGKAANFDVSYLDADIPDQTIKNDTLGAEQAVNQVFLRCRPLGRSNPCNFCSFTTDWTKYFFASICTIPL